MFKRSKLHYVYILEKRVSSKTSFYSDQPTTDESFLMMSKQVTETENKNLYPAGSTLRVCDYLWLRVIFVDRMSPIPWWGRWKKDSVMDNGIKNIWRSQERHSSYSLYFSIPLAIECLTILVFLFLLVNNGWMERQTVNKRFYIMYILE